MSPAYRAHPLAQAIEEAARIFGPEVTAAALLVAAEVRATSISRIRALGACSAICWHSAARSLHFFGLSIVTQHGGSLP
jgi:hypothetical protein